MNDTVTHIAGNRIIADGRVVQRCSLCGEKLCDSNRVEMPRNADGTMPEFPTWEVGRLVQVTAGNPTQHLLMPDTDRLPKDSCLELLEE